MKNLKDHIILSNLTNEETEAQEGKELAQGQADGEGQSQALKTSALEPLNLTVSLSSNYFLLGMLLFGC
jgi:hypothetical protein